VTNPRIVSGRKGSGLWLAARARARGDTFLLGVAQPVEAHLRTRLEDRLLEEARSLIRRAEADGGFDWEAHRFTRNAEFGAWEKTLTAAELRRLLE
jgi:hypothetical protein